MHKPGENSPLADRLKDEIESLKEELESVKGEKASLEEMLKFKEEDIKELEGQMSERGGGSMNLDLENRDGNHPGKGEKGRKSLTPRVYVERIEEDPKFENEPTERFEEEERRRKEKELGDLEILVRALKAENE